MPWIALILVSGVAVVASLDRATRLPLFILAAATVVALSSIRYKTGYDYDTYVIWYRDQIAGARSEGVEWAWQAVNELAHGLFRSAQGVFFISALLIYIPLAWAMYRESPYAAIGLLAFVLNTPFYWESLAILRQYIAIGFGLAAAVTWLRGRRVAYLLLVVFATLFHVTALVCLLVPFLTRLRSRLGMAALALSIYLVLTLWLDQLVSALDVFARFQSYFDGTIDAAGEVTSGLVVYARMLLALGLVVLIDREQALDERRRNLVVNGLVLAYALFLTLYESTALRRVAYYFLVYELLALGYLAATAVRAAGARDVTRWSLICAYLVLATVLLAKDVWTNPIGRQEDAGMNFVYRTVLQ
jgi:EpsG family